LGFGLSIATIARKTSKGLPQYDDADTFLFSNAEDLVPVPGSQRQETRNSIVYTIVAYRPRLEGLFAAIEHWTEQQGGASYWRVVSNDNITNLFGTTENTRIIDPANPDHIFQWLLAETFDARGNHIVYTYTAENSDNVPNTLSEINRLQTANKYLQRISYGNTEPFQEGQTTQETWHFEVVFDYGEYNSDPAYPAPYTPVRAWTKRLDSFSTYQAGFEIRTHRLCRQILMFHRFTELGSDPVLVHATRLHYQEAPTVSLLQAVESIGYRHENGQYQSKNLPLLEFSYTAFQPDGHDFEPLQDTNGQFLPGFDRLPEYQLVDLYGEGIPGVLYNDGRTTRYWEPEDSKDDQGMVQAVRYAPAQAPFALPIEHTSQLRNLRLLDLTGNGQLDLVMNTAASTGYYEAKPDHSWEQFRLLPSFPTDFSNPANYLVDVTGDGLADLLFLGDERILVYPSLGSGGFGPSLASGRRSDIPLPKARAENEVLQFADMFGSGMSHLVRITNGQVECWPNLGYGQFGSVVGFENAPQFGADLDASRLFLADLDGSGTADIIYAYPDHVEVFFNQSGNSFSDPLSIPLPGSWDRVNQIELADVFGNGTTSLLLSENHPQPHHWCYDFSQGQKPYLLNGVNNHLGAQSTITYCSSTRYYLEDKQKDLPWIVNLPFPVQVVEKTESIDLISQTRLVSTYAYHHGYYDGIEREFRGFGLVERWDAETLLSDTQPTNVPPVLTRTWYHTGAWQQDSLLSQQYQREYSQHDTQAYHLPISTFTMLEDDADAWREAYRALKGQVLREEVSSPTAPTMLPEQQQDAPYSVTEANYAVTQMQARGQNKYGVYFVHAQESLAYDYERNPNDPRVNHSFILNVDAYGNVLNSCAVTYGRRQGTGTALSEQQSPKVVTSENSFINQTGSGIQLLGVPQENKTYEIDGLSLMAGQAYVTFEQISAYVEQVVGTASARLLSWQRQYYWSPEQKQPYPLGQVSPQALLARTEEAVFSPAQVEQALTGALTKDALDTLLAHEGGYQLDPAQTYWWNPGLTESYLDASQFFLPF
ncbi:MAG TPA: SpvB/TcaC N-terminal domain-containing protein, partial [Ktedonobacteraceae bacterium]|nr:SpvB/TcaC N-terminal domain-containing protein [Ktedonobacteraceae bacterium]